MDRVTPILATQRGQRISTSRTSRTTDIDVEDRSLLRRRGAVCWPRFHPCNRLARRGGGDERRGRVDPAVYQALTRCTFRLVVLEVGVRRFAEHFELRSMGDDGEVPCFLDSSRRPEQSGIIVRGTSSS